MKKSFSAATAVATAAIVGLINAGPAAAADPIAQSTASALNATLLGVLLNSGSVSATHDGNSETVTGEQNPAIGVLGGQSLLQTGVLAQQVQARLDGLDGVAAACAGLAGQGSNVVAVGDGGCIEAGSASSDINLSLANLDLSGVELVDPDSALGVIDLGPANALLGTITSTVTDAVGTALGDFSNLGLVARLGAVDAFCTASPGTASGNSNIGNVSVRLSLPGQDITIAELDPTPAPNSDLFLNLDDVVEAVGDAVETQLRDGLGGIADPLNLITGPVIDAVVENVLAQLAPALAPLSQNVARIVLNRQAKPTVDSIEVTALSVELLPVLSEFGAPEVARISVADVTCGPTASLRAVPTAPTTPTAALPDLPTSVSAGQPAAVSVASASESAAPPVSTTVAALLAALLCVGTGVARRMKQ